MAIHGVIESTKMHSTLFGCEDALVSSDIDNGNVGYIEDGEFKAFTTATIGKQPVVILDTPVVNYDDSSVEKRRKDSFTNEAGTIARARVLKIKDVFGLNAAAISGTPAKDKYLILANGSTKLTVASSLSSGTAFACRIKEVRNVGATLTTSTQTYGYTYPLYIAEVVVNSIAV